MRSVVLIAHNLRSTHNVGSLLRTAEALGINRVYLTGYTPYPLSKNDDRLPHLSKSIDARIVKTALGAEKTLDWSHVPKIEKVISSLKAEDFLIIGLEQTPASKPLHKFSPPKKIAIIVGRETKGIEADVLKLTDVQLEIPMLGKKESLNVVQAAAIALYHLTLVSQ